MALSKTRMVVLGSLCAAAFTAVGVGAGVAIADQPHMQNALQDLQSANSQLQIADHDKGGHRENAINLVNQAISEVNLGIQFAGG
jgi:riboflavin biosynthesis pyrimidine reductase